MARHLGQLEAVCMTSDQRALRCRTWSGPPVQVPGESPPDVCGTKVPGRGLGQGELEGVCHGAAPAMDALLAPPLILDRA
jgi:hypothetical protein